MPACNVTFNKNTSIFDMEYVLFDNKQITYSNSGKFFEQSSGILHEYTPEMRAMNADFAAKYEVDERANYLFILQYSGRTMSRDAAGFMPRGSQFGYIFTKDFGNDKEILQTVAHELGHGRLLLKHTFDKDYQLPQAGTDNLMDYTPLATHLAKWQWDLASDPGIAQGVFDRDEDAMMVNTSIHLALTPDGNLIDKFYVLENGKEREIVAALLVSRGQYTIRKLQYNSTNYEWNTSAKAYINGADKIIVRKDGKKPDKVNLFQHTGEKCDYLYTEIEWTEKDENSSDIAQTVLSKFSENTRWIPYPYSNRDISCETDFIKDILNEDRTECAGEDVDAGDRLLRENLYQTDPVHLVNIVNSVCLSSLRKLAYDEKITLFTAIARQEELKEYSELALLRLMNALYTEDYKAFYQLLESDGNQLIKHLIDEIDDVSIYFWTDKNNYTNFIGALITMFAIAPEAYLERFHEAGDEKLLGQVFNLHPMPFASSREENSLIKPLNEFRYTGLYNGESGSISIYRKERIALKSSGIYGTVPYWTSDSDAVWPDISPLTPILVTTDRELPLVETALEGGNISGNYYIVPAIFLKFKGDKGFNEAMESAAMITLDAAIIAGSGGVALATKVHWARRIWALAEVATAVTHIGLETGAITNEKIREVNDIFYMAMGVIGIKNLGKGVVHFTQNLPNNVKTLIRENKSIRNLILSKYLEYRIAITKLKNSDEWVDLPAVVRQQIIPQDQSFITLADAKNIPNDKWGVSNDAFLSGKTSEEILSATIGSRPAPETYLRADYIAEQLAKFDDGIVRFTTKSKINQYGTLGSNEAFVIPASEYNKLRIETGNNLSVIEQRLGLNPGDLTNDDVVIAFIKRVDIGEIKIPSGNEGGAIPGLWLPGGKTAGGYSEAIVDLSNKNIPYVNY
jgi:hypothetical protein